MTEIRIRHEDYDASVLIGDVPLLRVGDVIPLLKEWGLYFENNEALNPCGLFAVQEGRGYFEVVIST